MQTNPQFDSQINNPQDMPIGMSENSEFTAGTRIKVIGVGGGGGNAVEHMIANHVKGVEFICANTDAQALQNSSAQKIVQLGNSGLGAGNVPEKGREAAEQAAEHIREAIDGAHMLFITAGMGGGTGTGAAPVVARIAREMGILTVGVVTKPFEFEGARCTRYAEAGLAELALNVDSMIVVLNDKLLEVLGDDVGQEEAFAYGNDVLKNAVGGIAEVINVPGKVNADFEDVKTVMSEPGMAMMGTASASGPDRARIAAEQAIACPLLEGVDLTNAKGILLLITASEASLKLSESRNAMNTVRQFAAEDAHVIYGTTYDDSLGDEIRITVMATGLGKTQTRNTQATPIANTVNQNNNHTSANLLTGTDNSNASFRQNTFSSTANVNTSTIANPISGSMTSYQPPPANTRGTAGSLMTKHPDRTHAVAQVNAMTTKGIDEMDIPAYLRKQAD